jgi:predicted permease
LLQDLKYALRSLRAAPGFAAIAILTLALGIGANLGILALVNAVLFQPLRFPEPGRLVRVFDDLPGAGARDVGMSVPELEDLRDGSDVFEKISAIWPVSTALSGGDRTERIEMLATSPSYFELLGARAALGRTYGQADWVPGFLDGVVISDGLWKRQFGASPNAIGRRIRVDEDGYTIIGVMPSDFQHPGKTLDGNVEIWAAAGFLADPAPSPPIRGARVFPGAMGRLKPGLTFEQAQLRLDAFVARLRQTYPRDYPTQTNWALRIEPAQTSLTGNVRPTLFVLLAAVGCVLLLVCVNVASLLIARSSTRGREIAIRQALGASRTRVIQQLLIESLALSLAGGAAAVAVLGLAQRYLLAFMPADLPRLSEVHFDWRLTAFAFGLSLLTGVLFGLAPALMSSSADPNRDLKEGGRGGTQSRRQGRLRNILVAAEIGMSVTLLIAAGLLARSFQAVMQENPGLDSRNLAVAEIWIPVPNNSKLNRYLTSPQRATLVRELLRSMSVMPGAEKAAIGTRDNIPFLNTANSPAPFTLPDDADSAQNGFAAQFGAVSPGYFDVLSAPIRRGRNFTDLDSEKTARVAIVNEAFVRKFSGGRDIVGKRVRRVRGVDSEIVGVVGDVRDAGLDVPASARVYFSIFQTSATSLAVFLRTHSDVGIMKEAITRTVQQVDPELPVFGVRTMDDLMATSMARRKFALFLIAVFATLALFLAALGTYGVMAFMVSQRKQEFSVRLALGARSADILWLAVRPGLILAAIGVVGGLVVSAVAVRLLSSLLFGVSPTDPSTILGVTALAVVVALIACWAPARRATRAAPIDALRS